MKPERLEIRKRIQEAGEKLYESIEDEDLKWLVGEIMCLNEYWVMENPDTYGAELILSQGFTDNQKKWITNLNKKLKKIKKIREWLLKEIEKLDRLELEEFSDEKFDNLHDPEEVIAHAVDYFKHLIKEAFSRVVKE